MADLNNPFSFTREQLATKLNITPDQVDDVKMRQVQDLLDMRKRNFAGDLGQQFLSGMNRSMAGLNMVAGDVGQKLGFEDFAAGRFGAATEDLAQSIKQAQQDPELARRLQEATQSESLQEAFIKLGKDPKALAALTASSFGSLTPQVPAALGATVAGGPLAGAAVFGLGSGLNEYSSKIFELMANAGIDVTDPEEVQALLQSEKAGPILRKRGALAGIPVAAFDALSYGLAGKIAATGVRGGLAAETGLQAGLGMAGAAGGQQLEQGQITNYSDIAAEGLLEAATAVPQAVIQPVVERALTNREMPDLSAPTSAGERLLRAIGRKGGAADEEDAPTITELAMEDVPAADTTVPPDGQDTPTVTTPAYKIFEGLSVDNKLNYSPYPDRDVSRKQESAEKEIDYSKSGTRAKGVAGNPTLQVKVNLPTSILNTLPGVNNEHLIRGTNPKYKPVLESIKEKGYDESKPVVIRVNHRGDAFINEGNNRVHAAFDSGVKEIPVILEYVNNAEDNKESPFSALNLYNTLNRSAQIRPTLQKKVEALESGTPTARAIQQQEEQAAGVRAPSEMLRGTPTQMRRRLNALSTEELVKRAVENAKIPEAELLNVENKKSFGQVQKYKPKKEIINRIFDKYGIDPNGTSVITNPTLRGQQPQPKPTVPTTLNAASRNSLFKLIRSRNASPEQKQQALNALEQQETTKQVRDILGLRPPQSATATTPQQSGVTADVVEAMRRASYVYNNPLSTPEKKEAARDGFVVEYLRTQNEVNDQGVKAFSFPNLLKKMQILRDMEDAPITNDMLKSPRIQRALLQDLYNMYRQDPNSVKEVNSKLSSAFKKAEDALARLATVQPPVNPAQQAAPEPIEKTIADNLASNLALSEYEAAETIRDTVTRIDPFLYRSPKYMITDQEYRAKPYTSIFRHILQKYDWFRSMAAIARRIPGFAGIYNTIKEQEVFRHNDLQDNMLSIEDIVENNTRTRIDKALEILDIMSRPGQVKSQSLTRGPDGRIKFVDVDGKTKVADKKTSDAIVAFSNWFKRPLAKIQQAIITEIASINNIDPRTTTRKDLMDLRDRLLATKQDSQAQNLTNYVAILDQIDSIYRSDLAYFPHTRKRGPYAIAVYEKVPEQEKPVLAGYYPVLAKLGGAVDEKDVRKVKDRILKDQETTGRKFVTYNGLDINTATPFYQNKNNISRLFGAGGIDKALQYEIITSLLTSKAINPKEIESLMEDFQLRNEIEKTFVGLRQRKGYLGYDIEDRLSSAIDSMQAQSSALTTFKYRRPLAEGFANLERQMQAAGPTAEQDLNILRQYKDHMNSPIEDWATLKAFNFWYFLALNPSTAGLQLTAPFLNTLPWIAQFASLGQFAKANVMAPVNFSKAVKILIQDPKGNALLSRDYPRIMQYYRVGPEEARILSNLKIYGSLDPNFAIEAIGDINLSNISNETTLFKNPVTNTVRQAASALMEAPESFARLQTSFMVTDALKDPNAFRRISEQLYKSDPLFKNLVESEYGGKITKEAVVRHAISENHAEFGKVAESPFFQQNTGSAALMFPFLKYPIQMLEQLRRLLTTRGPRGKAAFLGMAVLYPVLFGGLMSLPGYGTWDWLTKWYQKLKDDGSPVLPLEQVIRDTLGGDSSASWLYMKGPVYGGLGGVDISNRLSYQFWFQPILDAVLNPSDNPQANANQFLGGLGALLQAQTQASNQIAEGDSHLRAYTEAYAPNPLVRNTFKAYRIAEGDVETARGQRLLPSQENAPELYGSTVADEVVRQALGFRPQALSEASTTRFLDRTIKAGESSQYSKAAKQYARAYTDLLEAQKTGDSVSEAASRQKMVELYGEILDINNKSSSPKSAKELSQSLRTSINAYQNQEIDPLALSRKDVDPLKEAQRFGTPLIENYQRGRMEDARKLFQADENE